MRRFLLTIDGPKELINLLAEPEKIHEILRQVSPMLWEQHAKPLHFYAQEYYSLVRNYAFQYRRDFSFIHDWTTRDMRMLDYGAGAGFFSLASQAKAIVAVDVEGITTRFLRESYPIELEVRGICEHDPIPLYEEEFDFVVLTDVLEHLEAPLLTLKSIMDRLRVGGLLLYFFATSHNDVGHLPQAIE